MRPALWTAAALAAGIAAAQWLRPHPALALAALLLATHWAVRARRQGRAALALLLVVGCLGGLRHAYAQTAGRGDIEAWEGRKVTVVATVTGEPELRRSQGVGYVAAVERVDGFPAAGRLYVTQWAGKAPGFGERVEVQGRLKRPPGPRRPGGFDRAAYLARQGVYFTLDTGEARLLGPGRLDPVRRAAVATRIRLEAVLKATLPPRDAALLAGLLFGTRSELPEDIRETFKASGVFHLLAVSGGNIAMIAIPLLALLLRCGLSRRAASASVIPVVVFFVFLTGASPSVLRAGVMAVLVLLGDVLRRERDALNTLGAAVLLLLLCTPGLLFDLGFQLSLAATLGILLFARPVERWLTPRMQVVFGERVGRWLGEGLSITLAAQALVEPLSLYNFGTFSAIAPVANLLVLAFLEPIVRLGLVATLLGVLSAGLAYVLLLPVRAGLWALLFVVGATSMVPGGYLELGPMPAVFVLIWYGSVALIASPRLRGELLERLRTIRDGWRAAGHRSWLRAAAVAGLAAVTVLTWRVALADPPDTLAVTFLDVGQGDAVLIEAPGGGTMLVDAGPYLAGDARSGRAGYDAGEAVVLPHLRRQGIGRLDYLVVTHPDRDHAGGAPSVLRSIPVGALLKSDQGATEERYLEALRLAGALGMTVRQPVAGERIHLGGGVIAEILNPQPVPFAGTRSDDNSNCIAMRLTYRRVAILLPCDLEGEAEEWLVARGVNLRAHVLKASHHGSGHSSTAAFLQAVRPRWAVISAGSGNRYGHPHRSALERLREVGAAIYRTDQHGTITVKTNGVSIWVQAAGSPLAAGDEGERPIGILGRRLLFAW